jgi:hypothetical protein
MLTMRFREVRRFALSLPEAVEVPHFERTSLRLRRKIFATAPADGSSVNVFVPEPEIRACVAEDPTTFHELWWGRHLVGLTIELASASDEQVLELVTESWRRKAPKRLARDLDAASPEPNG